MTEAVLQPDVPAAPSSRRVPGGYGIWVGISCELLEFTVMFAVYFVARIYNPEAFQEGAERLSRLAGTVITLLMVTSSYLIACSVSAMASGRRAHAIAWLTGGTLVALGYPLAKFFEITWNLNHGLDGDAGVFFLAYYYLTLNHMVHAFWGILGMFWVMARLLAGGYSAENHNGMEALANYWHATDIVWLIIFPLFYVLA